MHYKQPDPPQTVDYSLKSILSWPTVVRRRNDRKNTIRRHSRQSRFCHLGLQCSDVDRYIQVADYWGTTTLQRPSHRLKIAYNYRMM